MMILRAKEITAGYTGVDILHNVSIRVKPGEIVSVIGPNGAGKSTLLKTIFGILKPRHGSVTLYFELPIFVPFRMAQLPSYLLVIGLFRKSPHTFEKECQ